MRCRACNCVLAPDDDAELCADCLGASGAENRAPIPTDDMDLVDFIEQQDDREPEQLPIEDIADGEDEEV